MVNTVKFSQFTTAPLTSSGNEVVGLESGVNVQSVRFLTWTSTGRPVSPFNGLLGLNTTLQQYEFWDAVAFAWVQLADTNIFTVLASHSVGEGASLIGLQNQSNVSNKTVQDFANATILTLSNTGVLQNGSVLTAGSGVTFTPGVGTLTVSATGTGGTVTSVTANNGLTASPNPIVGIGTIGIASIATLTGLVNTTGGSAPPSSTTLTAWLDAAIGSTQGDILYRNNTTWVVLAPGTSGQFLQTQGAAANPLWASETTGTVTSVATNNGLTGGTITTTGTLGLASIADHTLLANISGGATFPSSTTLTALIDNAIGSTQGDILYRSGTVWTVLAPGTSGQLLQTKGAAANPSYTTATYPGTGGAIGNILISDGTNYIASTSLWPNTVGSAGKIIRSDGTINTYSTATFPDTAGTSGNVLVSDGTNWSSSTTTGITALGTQATALNMGTHLINNVVDPVSAQDAATKNYVDQTSLNGTSVYASTTTNLTVTQSGSGVGATLTNAGAQATFALDGVNPPVGSNVLIKNLATASHEGIYTVTSVGSGATNWVLTRATSYDTATEINNTGLIVIQNGSTLTGSAWYNTTTIVTVDTTNFSYSQFGTGGTVTSVTFTGDGTVLSSTPSSAVTTSGTLTAALKTQTANTVLAGPTSGGAVNPTFRALVTADLPAGTGTVTSIATSNGVVGGTITSTGTIQLGTMFSINASAPSGAITLSSSGYLTLPSTPSFEAFVTSTSAAITGDNTAYTIINYTSAYDVTSSFNLSTGIFTAPVAGKYLFYASILLGGLGAGNTAGQAYFSGTFSGSTKYFDNSSWAAQRTSGTPQYLVEGTAILSLNLNATVKLVLQEAANGSKNVTVIGGEPSSTFGGFLLG